MTRATVYLPDPPGWSTGPGRLGEVELDVLEVGPAHVVLPEVTVRDERGGALFTGEGLVFDPSAGGGPVAGAAADRAARAFGVVNAAFHAQRALRYVSGLLGHPLPRLLVRIGIHEQTRRWRGGHYRLPGQGLGADPDAASPDGEVHLSGGAGFVVTPGTAPYFCAPAHNAAIICHEVGHHVCRHTADFRLNRLRPPGQQTNKKTALDEGTSDVITAMLLGTPDIYGWHRHAVPETEQRRRKLDPRWTMAHFQGGPHSDPHADGTVWASACWSARRRVIDAGADPARFDTLLLRGLELAGRHNPAGFIGDALRERRHFSRLMAAMAEADPALAPDVLAAMAGHGIHLGISNNDLSLAARARLSRQEPPSTSPTPRSPAIAYSTSPSR
ncbi:hypothetical protein [Pseudonocardia xinjiangensis]|uniref:HEXXH motif-containing protein n=1 Tax=Pseudonocardia xinjiangensis TaxID=75289 RepID=A0ABX1R8L6_9PSEU|nr:hypothetical protein [Pseudonocardia xinjiangensis]NMH76728.1 hypothetical protein [Pseudonocardia xinjiangensis]